MTYSEKTARVSLKDAQIGYTGEIVLTPSEEKISRIFDTRAGIDVWKLS